MDNYKDFYYPEKKTFGNKPLSMKILGKCFTKVTAICKILKENGGGSGFFCKIKFENNELIGLFTNNHILNKEDIELNNIIQIENDGIKKYIQITKERLVCTNYKLDYTFILVLPKDNFNNYFEIYDKINTNQLNKEYKDKTIIMMQYPELQDSSFGYGRINEINDYHFLHTIATEEGSSGFPIILSDDNLNVIGIHCGKTDRDNLNRGANMKKILEDIQKKFSNLQIIYMRM